MPPKESERDTRAEILELARELTQTQSFNWLSYQDLSDRLKIRKASIHYYFPSKTDLGVELIKDYRRRFVEWVAKISAKQLSPADMLEAYFEYFRKLNCGGERICPGGIFSLEWNTLPNEMKTEVKALYADHRGFMEALLKKGRKCGDFQETGSIDEQIAFIGATVQGALQLTRVYPSAQTFNMIIRQLKAALLRK